MKQSRIDQLVEQEIKKYLDAPYSKEGAENLRNTLHSRSIIHDDFVDCEDISTNICGNICLLIERTEVNGQEMLIRYYPEFRRFYFNDYHIRKDLPGGQNAFHVGLKKIEELNKKYPEMVEK